MEGDPSDHPMPWQLAEFQLATGPAATAAAATAALGAAPAPGACAAAPVFKFPPPPSAPPTHREAFYADPDNKAKARALKVASGEKRQGLTKEMAMVWAEYAGVDSNDPKGAVTNPDVMQKMLDAARDRVLHFEAIQAHPVYGPINAGLKDLCKAQNYLANIQRDYNKMHGVVVRRGRPVGSGAGAGAVRIPALSHVRFGTGRVVAAPAKAGQQALVSKTVALAPGYQRFYWPGSGKPMYVDSTFTYYSKSPLLVMSAAQQKALKEAIDAANAGVAEASPTASGGGSAEDGGSGAVPFSTMPVDAVMHAADDEDGDEEDDEDEDEERHRQQLETYSRAHQIMEERFGAKPSAVASDSDGDGDDGDEDVPPPPARGAKRTKAANAEGPPAKKAKRAGEAPAKRASATRAAEPKPKRARA